MAVAERQAAFALRQLPKALTESGVDASERDPLGELEADEQRVRVFEFYLSKIVSGQITGTEELRARLNQRFEAGFVNQGYLASEDGSGLKTPEGKSIQIQPDERLPVSDPQEQQLLLALYEGFGTAKNERETEDQKAESLNFYVEKILSGTILNADELKARLNQRFVSGYESRGILASEANKPLASSDPTKPLEIGLTERFRVSDPRQQQLLLALYEEFDSALREKQEARGFDFYINKILSGTITNSGELKARLNQRIRPRYEQSGLIEDENGELFADPNSDGYIELGQDERFKISDPEQQQVLLQLYDLTNDPKIPTEVKNLIRVYAKNGRAEDFGRLRSLLEERGQSSADRIEGFVENLGIQRRRASLRKEFYDNLFGKDVDTSLRVLGDFDIQDGGDLSLVSQLRNRAFGIRRVRVTKDFATSLASPIRDFDQALSTVDMLFKSPVAEDKECALILAQVAYKLELATYRDQVREMIKLDADPNQIYQFIDGLPIRPSIRGLDYLESQLTLKNKVRNLYLGIGEIARLKRANVIRTSFASANVNTILQQIEGMGDETQEERDIKSQLLTLYKSYIAANKPGVFDERFASEIVRRIEARLKEVFINPDLGRNREGFRYIKENFDRVLRPLVDSYRNDPRTRGEIERILGSDLKLKFIQRLSELEKQRPLTDLERSYIESVQLLSLFNPYLLAVLNADSAVTGEYLRHHFDTISRETIRELKDGDYVPLIQVGTGPNGIVALGEVVRNNPQLAGQMLLVDSGEQPGGPFAIPRGPAWELNSANKRGEGGYILPESPNGNELKTVRAYGSPLRWYPGERAEGVDIRQASINTTVDYLPTSDDLSIKRYPTNEELQLVLALQTAMLAQRIALKTTLVKVEPNPNADERGDKIATLKITGKGGGERTIRIKTDAVFSSTGLGEPTYGFRLQGSKAEKVLEQTKDPDKFPKLSTTLEAFRALSDRTKGKRSPGKTLVIWGKGNSADTLIEFIGGIFQGENSLIRSVTKVYIVSEGDLSQRPRYALISDLKPRNERRGNLIEQVPARVADVDFADNNGKAGDRPIVVLNSNGQIITDNQGKPIVADAGIAATGFRPALEITFESYLKGRSAREEGADAPLKPLTLPTNPDVSVAEYFADDPNILILGTASKPGFNSLEKLAQLPVEAKEALLRNGAENAVAIGFRGPDTQAAVTLWLNSRIVRLEPRVSPPIPKIPLDGENLPNTQITVERVISNSDLRIPDNLKYEDLELSPLLAYNIGRSFELSDRFNGNLAFSLIFNQETNNFTIIFNGGDIEKVSSEFLSGLSMATTDEYFQRYALSLLGKRRGSPKLNLNIAFRRGRINPQNTFVQAV